VTRRGEILAALLAAGVEACGVVNFVDPDADLKATLVPIRAERLFVDGDERAYFEVHIATRRAIDRVRLSAAGPMTKLALPLHDAAKQDCTDTNDTRGSGFDTCISITLGPGVPIDLDDIVLEVPELGHTSSLTLDVIHVGGYALSGDAMSGNTQIEVSINDPIRRHYAGLEPVLLDSAGDMGATLWFPRTFDVVTSSRSCSGRASPFDPRWTLAPTSPFKVSARFSGGDAPLACASVRPTLPPGGPEVAHVSVGARALVSNLQHVYTPAVEVSPLVFLPLFDLDLPTEQRCSEAEDLVRTAVLDAATAIASNQAMMMMGAEVQMLDPLQIATSQGVLCKQTNDRTFDGAAEAAAVLDALDRAYGPTRRVRVLLVYAENLDLEVPPALGGAINDLRRAISAAPSRDQLLFAIAPDSTMSSVAADRSTPWLSTEEPTFHDAIQGLLDGIWPFKTVVHTDSTVVPLVAEADKGRFIEYRLCQPPATVIALGAAKAGTTVLIPGPFGPSYTVSLPPEVLRESAGFMVPSVTVDWQGCEGLCNLPAPGGDPSMSWEILTGCR
jgi:hypothetical protein